MPAMATTTAVRAKKMSPGATRATLPSPSSLRDVRTALEREHRLHRRTVYELAPAFLLCTGILVFLQLFVLRAVTERAALNMLIVSDVLPVTVRTSASPSQKQMLLQALLTLPQVASSDFLTKEHLFERMRQQQPELLSTINPSAFADRMEVKLRSLRDFPAFFAFLRRPELSSVLAPDFLWELPKKHEELRRNIALHRREERAALLLVIGCSVLLFLVLVLVVQGRVSAMRTQIATLLLLGMERMTIRRPLLLEAILLILASLAASLLFAAVLFPIFFGVSIAPMVRSALWILLVEAVLCTGIAIAASRLVPITVRASS
jgi:cell division protein FtsX